MYEFKDVENFYRLTSKKKRIIETSDIATWIGCSIRYIQRLANEMKIPFERIHGRKNYTWNKDSIILLKTRLTHIKEKPVLKEKNNIQKVKYQNYKRRSKRKIHFAR